MKKALKNVKGITLVALVITIIILLILAGISISALSESGLFKKANDAKHSSEEAEENQARTLSEYESEIDKYLSNKTGEKLADKVKVGDYVTYIPDALDSNALATLKANLNTYSGNSDSEINPAIKRDELKWRVLDVQNGQVRLISETPTTSKIELKGYNGYNNAVKLIDDACSTLYTNKKLASKVQNLKIEDIQDKMVEKNYANITSDYGNRFTPSNKYYPSILLKEKEQKVTVGQNTTVGTELDLSEQKELINQTEVIQADTLDVKFTGWVKEMSENDFDGDNKEVYYNLFNGSNYDEYLMSSRCAVAGSGYANFLVRSVSSKFISFQYLFLSHGVENTSIGALRPVITLNSNVQVTSGNGNSESPFNIQ